MAIRYSRHLPATVFFIDVLLINFAFLIANPLFLRNPQNDRFTFLFNLILNFVWVVVSLLTKCFEVKRPLNLKDNVNRFLITLIYHLLLVFAIIYFFKVNNISRSEVMIAYSLFFLFIIIFRSVLFFMLDYYRKRGFNHRQILIIGNEIIADRLVKSFTNHPEYGYDLTTFISENEMNNIVEDVLIDKIKLQKPDEIFVCYKELNSELLKRLIRFGDQNLIKIKVVSDLILNNNYAQLVNYDALPVLQITSHPELSLKILLLKRAFDITFSSAIMVAGSPIFALIYVVTKISSKGPAFYRQERVGRDEKPFYIYKFRSMYTNAEQFGPQLSKDNDPRITKWGYIMRKTRLDELPQFFNVLKGEMSVVGPRPERQHFIEKIIEKTPHYRKLLRVKPGITSIGQVHYGYAENIDQMCARMRYDLLYLQNVNLNSDLDIIYKTVKVMWQGKGK